MPKILHRERFTGNDLAKRSFEDMILIDCTFEDYELEGAMLIGALFVGCTFKEVDFYWASMFRARFIKCALDEVCFRGATMDDTIFASCRLYRCDFSHDNLGGDTNISTAIFHECEQIDCNYKKIQNA